MQGGGRVDQNPLEALEESQAKLQQRSIAEVRRRATCAAVSDYIMVPRLMPGSPLPWTGPLCPCPALPYLALPCPVLPCSALVPALAVRCPECVNCRMPGMQGQSM